MIKRLIDKNVKIIKLLFLIVVIGQGIFAIIYISSHFGYVPGYGDTAEYLELAKTFELDGFRPIVFPLLLSIIIKLSNIFMIQYQIPLYILQLAYSFFAIYSLLGSIFSFFKTKKLKNTLMYAIFVFTLPLVVHFNMSVRYDSISISTNLLFLAFFIKFVSDRVNPKMLNLVFLVFFGILGSNIRAESRYMYMGLYCIYIVYLLYNMIKKKENLKKMLSLLIIALTVTIATSVIISKIFQNKHDGRLQPSVVYFLFERLVPKTLPKNYEYLSDEFKEMLPFEQVEEYVSHKNNYKYMYEVLYNSTENNDNVIRLILFSIKHDNVRILNNIFYDYARNMASPLFTIFWDKFGDDGAIEWTLINMSASHPRLSYIYLCYSNFVIFLIILYFIVKLYIYKFNNDKLHVVFILLTYCSLISMFFACLTSQNMHIRYNMPVYVIMVSLMVLYCFDHIEENKCKEAEGN